MSLLKRNAATPPARPAKAPTMRPLTPSQSKLIQRAHERQHLSFFQVWRNRWAAEAKAKRERRAEEASDRAERQRRKELAGQLEEEAYFYMDRIINRTAQMSKLSYRYKKSERDLFESGVQTIQFSDFVLQPEALYLKLDTMRLPRNVDLSDLRSEETLYNLSMSCTHRVLVEDTEATGFWYVIERASGVRGIPIHVRLDEMWSMRGPTHDGLSIPFGIGENKKPIWRSLTEMLSMVIAGSPGNGKSNLIHVALCTWIRFNSPHRVKLCIVDFKGGTELGVYAEIPHLMRYRPLREVATEEDDDDESVGLDEHIVQNTDEDAEAGDGMVPAFIERPQELMPMLRAIQREGRRRQRLFRQAGNVRSLGIYNMRNSKRALPRIAVLVDELAELRLLSSKEYDKVMKLITSSVQLFRSVGIHIVLCTQTITNKVLTFDIVNSLPAHVAFGCSSVTASTLIIGDGRAVTLNHKGRCILDWNGRQIEIQTPLIPDRVIEAVVQGAIKGDYEEFELARHDVTEEEVFKVALNEFAGGLPADEIYRYFNNLGRRIPRQEVREIITRYLNKEVTIGLNVYTIKPGSGSKPPFLVAMEEE